MRHAAFALMLLATPAFAQGTPPPLPETEDGPTVMERGLRLFLDGLMDQMAPAMRDMEDMANEARPLLEELERDLARALEGLEDLPSYEAPEILPNGDILIRRKDPVPELERNEDGSVDL